MICTMSSSHQVAALERSCIFKSVERENADVFWKYEGKIKCVFESDNQPLQTTYREPGH